MRKRIAYFLALSAALGTGSGADKVVGGPYVVNVGQRSATLMWVVETGHASVGTLPGKADKTAPVLRAEKVSFTGLQGGKTYYYDTGVGDDGKGSF